MKDVQTPSRRPINWTNLLFFTLTPLAAVVGLPIYYSTHEFSWGPIALLISAFVISNMSITCGYHRYFSHRSYDVNKFVEWLYVFFGSGSFQGSVLQWCTDHRRHHRQVDTDNDPYSINKGFWYAHLGWILLKETNPEHLEIKCPDLEKSAFIQFQHKHYALFATFVGFFLPGFVAMAFGMGFWTGVLFGGATRIVLSNHSTFLINSACHYFGNQPYTDKNSARDNVVMAFFTFGEGYHNFHHMFQADYRNGIRWYHWDPTKWWIQTLKLVGLASRLKVVSKEEILKARLVMEERLLISKGACNDSVAALKKKLEEAQERLRHLKTEYHRIKLSMRRSPPAEAPVAAKVIELKAQAKIARSEFKSARRQWRAYLRSYRALRA